MIGSVPAEKSSVLCLSEGFDNTHSEPHRSADPVALTVPKKEAFWVRAERKKPLASGSEQ
jgi:hypothetical protein